jgi:3D (Asp-Asp-Asp) domain-containing protein
MKTLSIITICIALAVTYIAVSFGCVKVSQGWYYRQTEVKEPAPYDLIKMNVSAYCPCELCCGEWADGITASGKPATGKLIAAPRNYAFGTVMDVPGYGEAVTVQDRGGLIKGNRLDLLFSTHQEALNWGRQNIFVKVYTTKESL